MGNGRREWCIYTETTVNPYSTLGADTEDTIAGRSASLEFSTELMQASLLQNYGLKIREFIVLSFLADQGPMNIGQLSRLVNIDNDHMFSSVERLADAGLVLRPAGTRHSHDSYVILSGEGNEVAKLIGETRASN